MLLVGSLNKNVTKNKMLAPSSVAVATRRAGKAGRGAARMARWFQALPVTADWPEGLYIIWSHLSPPIGLIGQCM